MAEIEHEQTFLVTLPAFGDPTVERVRLAKLLARALHYSVKPGATVVSAGRNHDGTWAPMGDPVGYRSPPPVRPEPGPDPEPSVCLAARLTGPDDGPMLCKLTSGHDGPHEVDLGDGQTWTWIVGTKPWPWYDRHGWVVPLPDDTVAKCGGPNSCGPCAAELVEQARRSDQP